MKKLIISLVSLTMILCLFGCDKKGGFKDVELLKLLEENSWFYDSDNNFEVYFGDDPQTYIEYTINSYEIGGNIIGGKHLKDNDYEIEVHFGAKEATDGHPAIEAHDAKIVITYDRNNPDELFLTRNSGTADEMKYHFYSEKGLSQEALFKMLEENGLYICTDLQGHDSWNAKNMTLTRKSSLNYYEVTKDEYTIQKVEYLGHNRYRLLQGFEEEGYGTIIIFDRKHPEHYYYDLGEMQEEYVRFTPLSLDELFAKCESDGVYVGTNYKYYAQFAKSTHTLKIWLQGTEYFESGVCSNLMYNGAGTYKMDFASEKDGGSYEVMLHFYEGGKSFYLLIPDKVHMIYDVMTAGKG